MFNRVFRRFRNKLQGRDVVYDDVDYLSGYVAQTQYRVAQNPKEAIGGMWEEIGSLQFDFLVSQGLAPDHKILDIGCGTLRGGRHFIRFLEAGRYTGIDIAPACIEAGQQLIRQENLEGKTPRLILNESCKMDFSQFKGEKFDFRLAQSVFTHLPEEVIDECFANVGSVMNGDSKFYFTYNEGARQEKVGKKDFVFPFSFFVDMASRYGFEIADISESYPHPRSQKMAIATKSI